MKRPRSKAVVAGTPTTRRRSSLPSATTRIGATEFAALVNSRSSDYDTENEDGATRVLAGLRRFVATVKHERRMALLSPPPPLILLSGSAAAAAAAAAVCGDDDAAAAREDEEDDDSDHSYYSSSSSSSSDPEESSDDDDDDDEAVPMKGHAGVVVVVPQKRYKKNEAWKEDTASYNVPFVGTSVFAPLNENNRVVPGEWPTGLLKAYLAKSPLAVELTGDALVAGSSLHKSLLKQQQQQHGASSSSNSSKKKKDRQKRDRKLSQSIHKAYLQALAELVTAAIPKETLLLSIMNESSRRRRRKRGVVVTATTSTFQQSPPPRFVSELVTKRLAGLLHEALAEETGHGKGKAAQSRLGSNTSSGSGGGCGPLAAPALRLLARLALTSPQTARHVARSLEQSLPDGVLRFLLLCRQRRQQRQRQPLLNNNNNSNNNALDNKQTNGGGDDDDTAAAASGHNKKSAQTTTTTTTNREKAQIAALHLASTLTEMDDAVVFSCISTTGVKDRKIRPGLLFLALQRGLLPGSSGSSSASTKDGGDETSTASWSAKQLEAVTRLLKAVRGLLDRPSVSRRSLAEIFSRECVQHVCHMAAAWAPPLTSSFERVLSASDTFDDDDESDNADRKEAGVEARRLLFLLLADPDRSPLLHSIVTAKKHHRSNDAAVQLVVRAMSQLLDGGNKDGSSGLEVRRFLLYATNIGPELLPAFFRVLLIPDLRRPFAFAVRLNCVSLFLRQGPRAADCLSVASATFSGEEDKLRDDAVALTIVPFGLKKQTFGKALQSPNHFVALEALKLFIVAMGRCRDLLADLAKLDDPELVARVADILIGSLPDLPILLTTLSKCDVQRDRKSNVVVFGYTCEAVRAYLVVFPRKDMKFDWAKLLPGDANAFVASPTFVQRMVLSSIKAAISSHESLAVFQPSSYKVILEVALSTRSEAILREARAIMLDLLCRVIPGHRGDEALYEATCWVDGLTKGTIEEYCALLQDATNVSTPIFIELAHAWRKADLPHPVPNSNLSMILVRALQRLPHASKEFSLLTVQVVIKCLLCDLKPLPLAVMIVEAAETEDMASKHTIVGDLAEYARSIIYFDRYSGSDRNALAMRLLRSNFSEDSYPLVWLAPSPASRTRRIPSGVDCLSLMQQVTHMAAVFEADCRVRCCNVLRRLVPIAIVTSGEDSALSEQLRVLLTRCLSGDGALVDCLFLSSGRRSPGDTLEMTRNAVATVSVSCNSSDTRMGKDMRFATLYLYVIGRFLPQATLIGVLGPMLELYGGEDVDVGDNPYGRLFCNFLQFASHQDSRLEIDEVSAVKLTAALLKAWLSLSAKCDRSPFHTALLMDIEDVLFLYLSNGIASLALIEFGSELLVRTCLATKLMAMNKKDRHIQGCLLASVITSDPVKFSSVFLRVHAEKIPRQSYRHLFDNGLLDAAFCAVLDCQDVVENHLEDVLSLARLVNARATTMLSVSLSRNQSLIGMVSILLSLTRHANILERESFPSVSDLLTRIVKDQLLDQESVSTREKILELALRLCVTHPQHGSVGIGALSSALLVYLCETLPRSLRVHLARDNSSYSTDHYAPHRLIQRLRDLLSRGLDYDLNYFTLKGDSFVTSLIRACLRYGIGKNSESNTSICSSCLELVRSLVVALENEASPLRPLGSSFSKTIASQVFSMVTSHSKFVALMSSAEEDGFKLVTVRILLCCLLATDDVDFDQDVWTCLLSCFNAGVSEIDLALRHLVSMYGSKAPKDSHYMFLDQLRWGEAGRRAQSNNKWEWLVESIELGRVYSTIERFPVHDLLRPQPFVKVDGSGQCVDSETSLTDGKDDQRYSPGFLLPLVLGALEDEACNMHLRSNESVSHGFVAESLKGKGALIAQRLCEKGAFALALASLASKCSSLRKLSVAIIGLLLEAVDSREAHQSASWRERPQIAMILNAVQRSLVVRYADDSNRETSSTFDVPELPGFSAIFLARASLVLARPSDPLFLAMNRSFLRTEVDGGGFQDLTRLPAFMSLFCSSSDAADQLAAERKFAIDLVKDGFTDEDSYKLLMACHCPELLLTSIESARARLYIELEDELPLLFTTLLKLISSGGEKSASHLLNRLGLLSWLRSLLIGNPVLTKLSSRIAFLKLLTVVARKTADLIPCDEFTSATGGLAHAALSLALECLDGSHSTKGWTVGQKLPVSMIDCMCQLLVTLTRAVTTQDDYHSLNRQLLCQSDGVDLESAIQFISALHSPNHLRSALFAICVLPVKCRPGDSSCVKSFCKLVLDSSMSMGECDDDLMLAVLWRVRLLSGFLDPSVVERKPILQNILAWRIACTRKQQPRDAWHACLAALVTNDNNNETDASLSNASDTHDLVCCVLRNERRIGMNV